MRTVESAKHGVLLAQHSVSWGGRIPAISHTHLNKTSTATLDHRRRDLNIWAQAYYRVLRLYPRPSPFGMSSAQGLVPGPTAQQGPTTTRTQPGLTKSTARTHSLVGADSIQDLSWIDKDQKDGP